MVHEELRRHGPCCCIMHEEHEERHEKDHEVHEEDHHAKHEEP
jgi:hypothetical protein